MLRLLGLLCLCALVSSRAIAQEPTNAPSATMPAPGLLAIKTMFRYDRYRDDPTGALRDVDMYRQMLHVAYGLRPGLVGFAQTSLMQRDIESPGPSDGFDSGVGDLMIGARYRFYRYDSGPTDTLRIALQGAVRLPTGASEFTTDTFSPSLAVNLTMIRGRHGFNASAGYHLTTGDTPQRIHAGDSLADHAHLSLAHLYRIAPASFATTSHAAWYTQLELLGHAETNGDTDLEFAPGLLYEARRWAAEASVLLPLFDDLEQRPDLEVGLVVGVRLLF